METTTTKHVNPTSTESYSIKPTTGPWEKEPN